MAIKSIWQSAIRRSLSQRQAGPQGCTCWPFHFPSLASSGEGEQLFRFCPPAVAIAVGRVEWVWARKKIDWIEVSNVVALSPNLGYVLQVALASVRSSVRPSFVQFRSIEDTHTLSYFDWGGRAEQSRVGQRGKQMFSRGTGRAAGTMGEEQVTGKEDLMGSR